LQKNNASKFYKQIELIPNSIQDPIKGESVQLNYTTHSMAIYTSRLLDFKDLPEPANASEGN
jgi:hypothetical protein